MNEFINHFDSEIVLKNGIIMREGITNLQNFVSVFTLDILFDGLEAAAKSKDQVNGRFLLNIIISESSSIF